MQQRSFKADLTGSDESLDDLLSRLKQQLSRPKARPGRKPPPDGHYVTSRRPRGGAGGAEAPLPAMDKGLPDCLGAF